MALLLAALVLLSLIAAAVTIADGREAPHRRVVAVERRQAWQARTADASDSVIDARAAEAARVRLLLPDR